MATVVETQAYLTEAKTPTVIGYAAFTNASKAYISFVGRMVQEAQKELSLLDEAEMVEPDAGLASTFEQSRQKLKAMVREGQELQQAIREMHAAGREFKAQDVIMRVAAGQLGYAV